MIPFKTLLNLSNLKEGYKLLKIEHMLQQCKNLKEKYSVIELLRNTRMHKIAENVYKMPISD